MRKDMRSKVYFTREITPENVVRLYSALEKPLAGRVAVKLHSGEKGNQNFLRPDFWRPIVEKVNGTVVECNTAYDGEQIWMSNNSIMMTDDGWATAKMASGKFHDNNNYH